MTFRSHYKLRGNVCKQSITHQLGHIINWRMFYYNLIMIINYLLRTEHSFYLYTHSGEIVCGVIDTINHTFMKHFQ